ncbi:MAG: hypothetical protein MUF57_10760, partial [Gammaproteobacteria bacterium]|nr:hypothetical protein [Gammaproteobacteria bacterium]
SYDLLGDGEKHLLERLAVFVGGFDLAAAEAVCGADPIEAFDVLDLLASLVDKSLVMLDERDGHSRYRMLETIRDYAHEKLDQRGDDAEATAVRHCQHFFAFAKAGRDGLAGADQALWTARLEADLDNLRAATALALAGRVDPFIAWTARLEADLDNLRAATALALAGRVDPFIAVKIAVALARFWMQRGYVTEGRGVVRSALELPAVQASDLARAWTLYIGAVLAGSQGDHAEERRLLEECLTLRRGLGDPVDVAGTLSSLALARLHAGDPTAAAQAEREALQIFGEVGNRVGEAIGHEHLGHIALYRGDLDEARAELERGLAIGRRGSASRPRSPSAATPRTATGKPRPGAGWASSTSSPARWRRPASIWARRCAPSTNSRCATNWSPASRTTPTCCCAMAGPSTPRSSPAPRRRLVCGWR